MKKLICVVVLCLSSPYSFADEESVQKLLDSVHKKGFLGCDDLIREKMGNYRYVVAKIPFAVFDKSLHPTSPKYKTLMTDEVILVGDSVGDPERDQLGGPFSVIIRKIGNQCVSADNFSVSSSIRRDCNTLMEQTTFGQLKLEPTAGDSLWVRNVGRYSEWGGASYVFKPQPSGGCARISLPFDMSQPPAGW